MSDRTVLALVPNKFGGFDVVDVEQLVGLLYDGDEVAHAIDEAAIDSTIGSVRGLNPETELIVERVRRYNDDGDLDRFWHPHLPEHEHEGDE